MEYGLCKGIERPGDCQGKRVVTANNVILENTCDRNIPAYVEGQLMLIGEGTPVELREMYIRELLLLQNSTFLQKKQRRDLRYYSMVLPCTSGQEIQPTMYL